MAGRPKKHECNGCRHAMNMEALNKNAMPGATPHKLQFCTIIGERIDMRVINCDRVLKSETK